MKKRVKRPKPKPGPSLWYCVRDLMTIFGVSDRTVWRWVKAGRLPEPVRIGRRWSRWPKARIDRIVRELGG